MPGEVFLSKRVLNNPNTEGSGDNNNLLKMSGIKKHKIQIYAKLGLAHIMLFQ